jgi:hypothetical protein
MLTPAERIRVDAAGEGSYFAIHRDSVAELVHDIRMNRVGAVLVSVACCDSRARQASPPWCVSFRVYRPSPC